MRELPVSVSRLIASAMRRRWPRASNRRSAATQQPGFLRGEQDHSQPALQPAGQGRKGFQQRDGRNHPRCIVERALRQVMAIIVRADDDPLGPLPGTSATGPSRSSPAAGSRAACEPGAQGMARSLCAVSRLTPNAGIFLAVLAAGAGHQQLPRQIVRDEKAGGTVLQAPPVLHSTVDALRREGILVLDERNAPGQALAGAPEILLRAASEIDDLGLQPLIAGLARPVKGMAAQRLAARHLQGGKASFPAGVIEAVLLDADAREAPQRARPH